VNGHFDNLKGRYRLKGILVGVDKIVLYCFVVAMYVLGMRCLIELDGKGLSEETIAVAKDCVLLVDDGHKNSMMSVNSDINNL
jgi:hypothetical protein